ncbi:MAG: GTPase ObgE [Oscillospiraceae bacterium]|jgi:GTP-binding protein|nr:GTPase ObgE [Oscillospiraceae bacterium]
MFVDQAVIHIRAGRGGDGAVAFHREKYVASGGPDGGDGGRGGSIYVQADAHMSTLLGLRNKRKFAAGDGEPGGGKNCSGKGGKDFLLRVPRGTLVYDAQTGRLMADISGAEPVLLARGGRGGWGNQHFASSTRQAPRFAKAGLPGQEFSCRLELKLLADVGLIGFPNVGKSSLLSVISAARPKIDNYHFTTLQPNLGVVAVDGEKSFVCADIPGLIEGASRGSGLGHAFLRHIERCRLLIHVVDVAGTEDRDPCDDFDVINAELRAHLPELALREQIVAANKTDALSDPEALERLKAHVAPRLVVPISAATTAGVRELVLKAYTRLLDQPPIAVFTPEPAPEPAPSSPGDTTVTREDGFWRVEGEWLYALMGNINFSDYESKMYFDRCLRKYGVFELMENAGVRDGDTVYMYGLSYEYAV